MLDSKEGVLPTRLEDHDLSTNATNATSTSVWTPVSTRNTTTLPGCLWNRQKRRPDAVSDTLKLCYICCSVAIVKMMLIVQ